MFFRPNFCANCGEKIERIDWTLWSSRRFCDLCATDFVVQEYAPRIIAGIALLAIVSTAGAFFSRPDKDEQAAAKRLISQKAATQVTNAASPQVIPPANVNSAVPGMPQPNQASKTFAAIPQTKPPLVDKTGATDIAYFCGAETKKGTACSRRVKGNIRCYQHVGMPAMLSADKLKIG